jgi:hypothetical protein
MFYHGSFGQQHSVCVVKVRACRLTVLVLFSRLSGGVNATSSVAAEKVGPCFIMAIWQHTCVLVQWEPHVSSHFLQPPSLRRVAATAV